MIISCSCESKYRLTLTNEIVVQGTIHEGEACCTHVELVEPEQHRNPQGLVRRDIQIFNYIKKKTNCATELGAGKISLPLDGSTKTTDLPTGSSGITVESGNTFNCRCAKFTALRIAFSDQFVQRTGPGLVMQPASLMVTCHTCHKHQRAMLKSSR